MERVVDQIAEQTRDDAPALADLATRFEPVAGETKVSTSGSTDRYPRKEGGTKSESLKPRRIEVKQG